MWSEPKKLWVRVHRHFHHHLRFRFRYCYYYMNKTHLKICHLTKFSRKGKNNWSEISILDAKQKFKDVMIFIHRNCNIWLFFSKSCCPISSSFYLTKYLRVFSINLYVCAKHSCVQCKVCRDNIAQNVYIM